jgi:hypothetical protein
MVRGISGQPQTFACAMCHLTRCSSRAFLGIGCLACHLALSVGISVILYERLRSALAPINVATITLLSSMLAGCAMTHNARHFSIPTFCRCLSTGVPKLRRLSSRNRPVLRADLPKAAV